MVICSGNLAILACGRLGCAPLGDNSGTHRATGVARHLLFPVGGGSTCFVPFDTWPTWAYPSHYMPALASSAFSMLAPLPCLAFGAATNGVARSNSLSMFCIRYGRI